MRAGGGRFDGGTMPQEAISDLVKDKIGAFKVVRSLGKGLMGEVFLGMTGDNVHNAIKVINYKLVKKLTTAVKFEKEIKDDAIMQISIRTDPKLQDYFVMDFLEVRPVSRKVAGPYGHTKILEIFIAMAKALEKAHKGGAVHGNIKSSNVLIRRSGKNLMPFINDFGLEYVWDKDFFQGDNVSACLPYMSPEKIKAFVPDVMANDKTGDVGPQADVYSLAVVMVETLTGKLLFSDTDDIEGIIDSKRNPRIQLISVTHPSRKIDIKALNDLMGRSLSFDRKDRPSGMKEFAEALEKCRVPKEKMFTFE